MSDCNRHSFKTSYFRHSVAAHFYRSRDTLVCRGTQVGKHCVRVKNEDIYLHPNLEFWT